MKFLNLFSQLGVLLKILKKSAIYIIAPVFFIYILLDKPDYAVLNAIHKPIMAVALPFGQMLTWPVRAVKGFGASVIEYNYLAEDNEKLRKTLDEKITIENEYKFLKSENERMVGLLKIKEESKTNVIIGKVIGNNNGLGNTFVINVGSNDGVRDGEVVLSHLGNLLGFVISSTGEYSKVRNLNDINSNIIVRVAGTEVFGFLQGNNGKSPYFEYYSDPDFEPAPGMQLVTSNMNSLMPSNIPIGEISKIYSKSRSQVRLYDASEKVMSIRVLEYDFREKYKEVSD
ncbi:MAG: rod shape-determining protein MreC [Rickettsiales bacterium]|jgi:rod shape-determining protein MreC|nr:rod shape-determining protein MreC [Rickettsiales bacterium]